MSHPPFYKLLATALLAATAISPLGLLAGCSDGEKNATQAPVSNATLEDRRLKLKSDLAETQLRLTELEQRLTDLQNQQNRALEDVVKTTTRINKEFVELKAEALALASGAPAVTSAVDLTLLQPSDPAAIQTTQPIATEPTVTKAEGPSKILRIILWVIVVIAIGFFVRLFIARKDEEFDDYDQAEESPDVKLNEYGSVQMPRDLGPSPGSTTDEDINQAGRP